MSDRLSLSCWLRGFHPLSMLHHWEKLLLLFPYSRLAQAPTIARVCAISTSETPLIENEFPPPFDPQSALQMAREFQSPDCAYQVETFWELLLPEDNWSLRPARVSLWCFGPEFENDTTDHLRMEFGLETQFLPIPGNDKSLRAAQANLKSLTHLIQELTRAVPIERQHLWSESGTNFASKLEEALSGGGPGLAVQ